MNIPFHFDLRRSFAGHLAAATLLLGIAAPVRAAVNDDVWKMKYNVSAAIIANPNLDNDGDGIANGAEKIAGTDPASPASSVKITSITMSGNDVSLTFPTQKGTKYVVQGTADLAVAFADVSPAVDWIGTGTPKTLTFPKGANKFFRVQALEADSDSDGASDWAENIAGYNPNNPHTFGGTTNDGVAMANALASMATANIVTVTVNNSTATQPLAGFAPIDVGSVTVARGSVLAMGELTVPNITVPLQKSGTATEGTDYDNLVSSAAFTAGVSKIVLTINPKANSNRKTNVTAIVKALAGAGYTLGSATSGSVVINPAGIASGTGLTAKYHNTSHATYGPVGGSNNDQLDIFAGTVEMSRTDATIDFSNGVNGWGLTAGPTGMSPVSSNGAFSVRWTGQILPKYSETYSIDFRSDDGAKVWVNNVLLIDRWVSQSATDYVSTIALQAGVLYDIKIEYWNTSGAAEAKLYWWSDSQTKEIIPTARLFPEPAQASKFTAITSSLTAVGYEGVLFGYFTVASPDIGGAGTSYALAANSGPLPPGLSLNTSTGEISGTPTAAGTYNVAITATNIAAATITGSSVIDFTIYPTGGVTREILATTAGGKVSNIIIPADNPVPTNDTIATIDDDSNRLDNVGLRLRGYIVPPKTGNYYFWVAASNAAELWISNDSQYVNKVRRASVTASTGKKTWNAAASQQSQWLSLVAGQKYYFEVLQNSGNTSILDDYVAVGWCQDDVGTQIAVTGAANATGAATIIPNGAGATLQGYPLSGTVPGYIFQPYDYPVLTPQTGTLYACNLGPQAAAATSASGSASLQVNQAKTSAILRFTYQNLTTPKTAYHLHVDGFTDSGNTVHPNGEIVFDIDDADSFPPELRTADGGYVWEFVPVGSFSSVAKLVEAIEKGKVYLNVHSVTYPAGEIRGTFSPIEGSQTAPVASAYPEPAATDDPANDAHAARFLNQATYGASPADIAYLETHTFAQWIDDQLTKPGSYTSNDVLSNVSANINQTYGSSLFVNSWWKNSITGGDQLRQRLALALSEIMVISWANDTGPLQNNARYLADFYDELVNYCLPTAGLANSGNFRGVLKAVTLTPAMGVYLDMRGNQLGDPTIGRHPNENYAREIMQLFSVGIYRMWDDGKFVLGADAGLIPTYAQPSIIGLSHLLTGWTWAQSNQGNGRAPTNFGPGANYLSSMTLVPRRHERKAKLLLNNVISPAATGLTPRVSIQSIPVSSSPCTINTVTPHGLKKGDTVRIANSTALPASINATFMVDSVTSPTAFRVALAITGAGGAAGTVTGAKVLAPPSQLLAPETPPTTTTHPSLVTGSQSDDAGTGTNHPYDVYGLTELDFAIDNIVNDQNVGPYVCRQLIQRFVTSDPSPGYVYRVVQKFNDNGSGVRGDLAAVIRQILLDGEARRSADAQNSTSFGKQREPMLRLTGPARAFPTTAFTGTYTQLTGVDSNKLRITTSGSHNFSVNFPVSLNFQGNYTHIPPAAPNPYNNPTTTGYTVVGVPGIVSTGSTITNVALGAPCVITTAAPHGLNTGNSASISGVVGGSYKAIPGGFTVSINDIFSITKIDDTSFSIPVNCEVAPTSIASAVIGSNPCRIVTTMPHGMSTGNSVTISGVSGGNYFPNINDTYTVTVLDATSFTIPVNCVAPATNFTNAQIVGTAGMVVAATGMVNVTYTQPAGSNTMTVSVAGPQTDRPTGTGGTPSTIKSKVYLDFLTQTDPGGAAFPADGIYDVQANAPVTANTFTVTTADTPATPRTGNVLIPRITTSYTPSGTNIIYNTFQNHNLQVGNKIWVDVPVVGNPVHDAEYAVSSITDEDHFVTSRTPNPTYGGTYTPNPSGSNNGVTIWPLLAPPLGRSGTVVVDQSSFNLNSTESTLTQSPLNAPTVFNFFSPDYKFPGDLANNGLDSPEFQLTTDTNVTNLTNSLTNMVIGTGAGNQNPNGLMSFNNGGGSVVMSIQPYLTPDSKTANPGIPALIDELSNLLVGGPLQPATKQAILTLVQNDANFPYTLPTPTNIQKRDRVRAIIHLIITSAEYAVQK